MRLFRRQDRIRGKERQVLPLRQELRRHERRELRHHGQGAGERLQALPNLRKKSEQEHRPARHQICDNKT